MENNSNQNSSSSLSKRGTDSLHHLAEVVKALRNPVTGCPWDSVQTNLSIRKYLVEETGEYLDALEAGDWNGMKEELGDLLLQVVLNSRIAEEAGHFSLEEVAAYEAEKMIRRHPHVFGESKAHTEAELRSQWEKIKSGEGDVALKRKRAIDGVPRSMPALARAHKMIAKSTQDGVVVPPCTEQLQTLQKKLSAISAMNALSENQLENQEKVRPLLKEILFGLAGLCRQYDLNSEELLQEAIGDFIENYDILVNQPKKKESEK